MAQYEVEVGGFMSQYRSRKLVIYAKTEQEAKEKAEQKFIDLMQKDGTAMCGEGTINSIYLLKGGEG